MKKIYTKLLFVLATAILGLCTQSYAAQKKPKASTQFQDRPRQQNLYAIEQTKKASNQNFTFEIKNKGSQPFYLTIFHGGNGQKVIDRVFVPQATNLQPGYVRIADLSTYPSLTLVLQFFNTSLTKSTTYTYDILSQGTSTFVSWDGSKIVPQTGSYWGLSGYTESGIPISTNVEPQDIELVEQVAQ
jgi:hypothetical protein